MADTIYTWTVPSMERNLADGMVTTVHYQIAASDGIYSSSSYGCIGLDPADPTTMIPYADLDEFTVASWVAAKLGPQQVQKMQQSLENQIALQRTPVTGSGTPWNAG